MHRLSPEITAGLLPSHLQHPVNTARAGMSLLTVAHLTTYITQSTRYRTLTLPPFGSCWLHVQNPEQAGHDDALQHARFAHIISSISSISNRRNLP